jgi:tetratricopeptide (TPR) repeat protein
MSSRAIKSLIIALALLPAAAWADASDTLVANLQHSWALANYQLSGDAQAAAFEVLIEQADTAVANHPRSADLLIWNGIIKSSYAGAKGGFGALSLAREAKASFERAMAVDDTALNGSAYASLGTLYYKVPGWPVGFGSDRKAVQLLEKALEINPDGIDSNYFYADFLLHKKDYEKAEQFLLKAQSAPPRPGRDIADAGRQQEILAALSLARDKLQRSGS